MLRAALRFALDNEMTYMTFHLTDRSSECLRRFNAVISAGFDTSELFPIGLMDVAAVELILSSRRNCVPARASSFATPPASFGSQL